MTIVLTMLAAPEWKKGYAVEVVFVSMVGTFLHKVSNLSNLINIRIDY
jgi:hypothetical protein